MLFVKDFYHAFLHALKNLLPIVIVVVFFQLVILQQLPEDTLSRVLGLLIVALGVALFLQGLELSIFPVGKSLSNQFAKRGSAPILLAFGFAIGFSAVVAEPALIAVAQQAQEAASGKLNGNMIRILVAIGVAVGISIGVHRIIVGGSMHYFIMSGYVLVIILTLLAPRYIVALAYDLGGVTTSEVTVPLVTALGIGLATHIEGRNVLIDGFGLIAFASIFPIVTVMIYAIAIHWISVFRKVKS